MKNICLVMLKRFLLLIIFLSVGLYSQDNFSSDDIILISPKNTKTVVSKKPLVICKIAKHFSIDSILIILDDTDITQMVTFNKNGFTYKPFLILSSGEHTLSITISGENNDIQKDLYFSTKQSNYFDTDENKFTISPLFEATMKKPETDNETPYSEIEGAIGLDTQLKNENMSYSFSTNLRFLEQSNIQSENKEGFDLAGYLYSINYEDDKLQTLQVLQLF
ncbi:MAG: hypothetical protein L3J44_05720 [Campylobacteraceae bacterium]|nr:hypothetical protein [Campylobacteraceae bacterium]